MNENEFKKGEATPHHLTIGPMAKKTIFASNIIGGVLSIDKSQSKGKVIVSLNADDS